MERKSFTEVTVKNPSVPEATRIIKAQEHKGRILKSTYGKGDVAPRAFYTTGVSRFQKTWLMQGVKPRQGYTTTISVLERK